MPTYLYTGATFKTLVADHLNRDDLTSIIPDFCALAIKELEKKKLWFQLTNQATLHTTAHQGYTSLPSDFLYEVEKEIGETLMMPPSNYPLTKMDYPSIIWYQKTLGGTENEPYYFAITDQIYWYPVPDQIYSPTMSYYKHLAFPADNTGNEWTDTVWDLTFWAVIVEACRYIEYDSMLIKAQERMNKKLSEYQNQYGLRQSVGRVRLTSF